MSKISYSIMAIPSRKDKVEKLKDILGDIPVSYDTGNGIWWNRCNAMKIADQDSDFICVLQDDALPCKDFYNKVDELVKYDFCYSLYMGKRQNKIAEMEKGLEKGYIKTNVLKWGVAVIIPTRIVKDLIKYWEDKNTILKADDTRISNYLRTIKMPVYYPLPSLVEHNDGGVSYVGDKGQSRKAFKFIDND